MSVLTVLPNDENLTLGDIADDQEWQARDLLGLLGVESISVDPDNQSWCVTLRVSARTEWNKTAKNYTLEEFEGLLFSVRQHVRAAVPGLSQLVWSVPESLRGSFRPPSRTTPTTRAAKSPSVAEAVPMCNLTGGERGKVTVSGDIVEVMWRTNQRGRLDCTMVVSDRTDSLKVRLPDQETKLDGLVPGARIIVKGSVAPDRFDGEPLLATTRKSIVFSQPEPREDPSPDKRVELHLHTKMSQMDSVLDVGEAVRRAAQWGHPAIAITDHGVVQAFPDAYAEGQAQGIKVILGLEAYMVEDDEKGRPYHVVLLAKDRKGLRRLYEIVTLSHLDHFYRTARVPKRLLLEDREGLLVGSACEAGEVIQAILAGKSDEELREVGRFYDYLEIQPLENNEFLVGHAKVPDKESLRDLNRRVYLLSKELELPCVLTGDVHYLDPEDGIFRTILLSAKGMTEGERSAPLYLRTTAELLAQASSYLGDEAAREVVVTNPLAIAESIESVSPVPQGSFLPKLPDADKILRDLAMGGATKLYGPELPQIVSDRLEKELSAIIGNGFSSLYLIAIRMVEKSLEDGYVVGSRGSVGSSLVATCTGVTEVNPLLPHYVCPKCHMVDFTPVPGCESGFDLPPKDCPSCGTALRRDGQDIPFETFMGFHGEKVPDIDLNFSSEEQAEMFKFAEELLGQDNVFRAGTISTVARKTAYGFVKHYAEDTDLKLRGAEETRLSVGLEGVKRTTGQHPGGVMVIPKGMDVLDFTPLQRSSDGRSSEPKSPGAVTTHFDYNSIKGHLVKVDILGHEDPTAMKMLHEMTGVDPMKTPMDDPETLALFRGDDMDGAVGIPEFGTRFVRTMLTETRPRTFAGLVRISGLSHGTDVWANNARDAIRDGIASLEQVIATREDIFLYLMKLGVNSAQAFGIAEKVRNGKPLAEADIEAMRAVSVPDWYIASCNKITYLFPKSHAVAYVTMAFRIAYFKVHHPLAFAAVYFTLNGSSISVEHMHNDVEQWRKDIVRLSASGQTAKDMDIAGALEVAVDMAGRGVQFGKLSLYLSDPSRYLPHEGVLLPPFTSVPGVGNQAAQAIHAARERGEFSSIEDFRRRTKLGKKVIALLEKEGLFEGLPEGEQLSLFN